MRHVSFVNQGLIDLRAVKTFGASSKENASPIGYFGTGLKFAIAVFLRLGCRVELWRGLERFEFAAEKTRIRVDDFDVVTMNGEELAFTTQLGRNWKAWQAFREMWCNAIDEDGVVASGRAEPGEHNTVLIVRGEPAVEAYYQREAIMLTGAAKWVSNGVEIHNKGSLRGYYRNVRVLDLEQPAELTYNVCAQSLELTEDRTLAAPYMFTYFVKDALLKTSDETLIDKFVYAQPESFEAGLNFSDGEPSKALVDFLKGAEYKRIRNLSLLTMLRKQQGKTLRPQAAETDDNENRIVARAKWLLEKMGYAEANRAFPVIVTDDLDDNVLGCAYEGEIYINRRTVMRGSKMVAGTIFEEYVHLRHKLRDESRGLQDYLLDALMTMGEKFVGEPA